MTDIYLTATEKRVPDLEKENAQLKAELQSVDTVLSRRPALADLQFRTDKIERACAEAGRADQLKAQLEQLDTALHDVFETLTNQKSNRGCCAEGIIDTAKAAARVMRKVADEAKQERDQAQAACGLWRTCAIENATSKQGDHFLSTDENLMNVKMLEASTTCGRGYINVSELKPTMESFEKLVNTWPEEDDDVVTMHAICKLALDRLTALVEQANKP